MNTIYEFNRYSIHFKTSDKFKTFLLECNFFNNHDFKRLASREALLRMIFMNNKKYKTSIDISKKCEDLYDPYLYYEQSLLGNIQVSTIFMKFIDPKYIDDKSYYESIISYFFDLINDVEFTESSLNFVKDSMINDLNSINDNPSRYASLKFYSLLDKNDPRSVSLLGTFNDIKKLTIKDIENEYKNLMENSRIHIILVASDENEEYFRIIDKYQKFKKTKKYKSIKFYRDTKYTNGDFSEEKDYSQSNLIMLFNLKHLTEKEKNITMLLFNEILGGYSVNAILNRKLREENSICYGVNSSYDKYDNDFRVITSINLNNVDKAKELIFECINNMDNITDDDLEDAKKRLRLTFRQSYNSIFSIASVMLFSDLGFIYDTEEKLEYLDLITLDDIKQVSKKIIFNSSFVLKGVKNENN